MLHAKTSLRAGHCIPVPTGLVVTVRVYVWTPPPHCALHSDDATQSLTTQSTGQGLALQGRVSLVSVEQFSIVVGGYAVTLRSQTEFPPPQGTEQVVA